jgi:hypothetical protein
MENNTWENFKEGDLSAPTGTPLEGDMIIGEKPLDEPDANDAIENTLNNISSEEVTTAEEPVAPITDMTVNNTMVDDAASVTTPQIGDDVLKTSDAITDYSEFLDNPADVATPTSLTTPEEDSIISDAITNPIDTSIVANDEVQITIKNPENKPIEIKINGEKEDAINNEVDAELDEYHPEEGYTDEGFYEHLCKKYNYQGKLEEGESISSAICKLISEVANR